MELVIDKMMKKKVSIISLTLSIVIAAAWTLRWAIDSRDVSLGELANLYGGNITAQDITEIHLQRHLFTVEFLDEEKYYRSKISRNYLLFEPKCRNNAEITYT